jgi:hypothetical protein
MSIASLDYITQAKTILDRIESTQIDQIERAAEICARTIAGDGLVHLLLPDTPASSVNVFVHAYRNSNP